MSVRSVLNNSGVFNYAKAGTSGLSAKSLIITEGDLTFADGSTQSTASSSSDPSTWSTYPAISNVDCSTYGIKDSTSSLGITGQFLTSEGGSLLWADSPTPPPPSNWSTYPAVSNVLINNHAISSIGEMSLDDNVNNRHNLIYPISVLLQNNAVGASTEIYTPLSEQDNICFQSHNSSANTSSILMAVQPTNPTITLYDGTNTSILSASQIQFNGISLCSTVATNTSDIATNSADIATNSADILTNSGNIATNTTNIATNTTDISTNAGNISTLKIKQTITTNQNISAAIYADAKPPLPPTTTIAQTYAFTPSWYFKNSFATNNKINWYIGPDINMIVADVLGLYMNIFNGANTSNDNCPFITFYTKPQSGDPNFYHSKRTYIFNQSVSPIANTRYFMFQNMTGTCPTPFHYGSTLINMALSPVGSSNFGPFLPDEQILAFSIGTNSVATINTIEFAINRFGIMTINGTQEIAFIPL
jgi:hypothetical protein